MVNAGKKSLKICSWNIEGLLGKLDDEDFLSTINSSDCITLVESWMNNNTVDIQGFYSFSKFRKRKRQSLDKLGWYNCVGENRAEKSIRFFDKETSEQFL